MKDDKEIAAPKITKELAERLEKVDAHRFWINQTDLGWKLAVLIHGHLCYLAFENKLWDGLDCSEPDTRDPYLFANAWCKQQMEMGREDCFEEGRVKEGRAWELAFLDGALPNFFGDNDYLTAFCDWKERKWESEK